MFESLKLWWHRRKTRSKMERVFGRGQDPFGYRRSSYETARLAAMEAALGGRRYERALEVGCAEGDFTEKLLAASERVTAVDISPTAIGRLQKRLGDRRLELFTADLRDWSPPAGKNFDLIVLGDVLYYLDKPMVREHFEAVFPKLAAWLAPGGRLVLAHGFAGDTERAHRQGFRERFERQGLKLISEAVVAEGLSAGPVSCLLGVLERGK
ncbi:MAG: SAM-dependent methyltransferase [Elusimicrobiota bacterium]